MKKFNYFTVIVFWFMGVFFFQSYAQQTDENTELITKYFQSINYIPQQLDSKNNNLVSQNYDTYVVIQQIGVDNVVDIKGSINNSQNITQQGNKNQYNFINYYNKAATQFDVSQQGNANSLQIYGSNSIIKNLNVAQSGDLKTIIINNY